MYDSQSAYVDSGEKEDTTRWAINQRSEPSQSRLLDQTSIFFNYFESIEFSSIRATIMSLKVCEIVNAHKLIRAGKDDDRREIDHSAQWIFSISFTRSNLDIIQLFLKHWIQLTQSYNYVSQSMWGSQRA